MVLHVEAAQIRKKRAFCYYQYFFHNFRYFIKYSKKLKWKFKVPQVSILSTSFQDGLSKNF